jgi:DNA repair protein RecO (recombination protein O)
VADKRIVLEPSYLLHTRSYRDTSVIAHVITQHYGQVTGVVRGVRSSKSKRKGVLQPFCPLVLSWTGRGDLVSITGVESAGRSILLSGNRMICGLYVNELSKRLLPVWQGHESIFGAYIRAITLLEDPRHHVQVALRQFERQLLEALGYGVDFKHEAKAHQPIVADGFYCYQHGEGFLGAEASHPHAFSGAALLAIAEDDYKDVLVCQQAKRLMRTLLAPLLGNKPLMTRELLV